MVKRHKMLKHSTSQNARINISVVYPNYWHTCIDEILFKFFSSFQDWNIYVSLSLYRLWFYLISRINFVLQNLLSHIWLYSPSIQTKTNYYKDIHKFSHTFWSLLTYIYICTHILRIYTCARACMCDVMLKGFTIIFVWEYVQIVVPGGFHWKKSVAINK